MKPETAFKVLACVCAGAGVFFLWMPDQPQELSSPEPHRFSVLREMENFTTSAGKRAPERAGITKATEHKPAETAQEMAVAARSSLGGATGLSDRTAQKFEPGNDGTSARSGSIDEADGFSLRVKEPSAVLPLTFQAVSPETVKLSQSQAAAVAEIQDQFADAVGGETAKADSPDYRKRWDKEQRLSDLRLRALIGGQAFAAWQREAHWRALEAARSAPGTDTGSR